jgi:preprotein translocase subunit YajC
MTGLWFGLGFAVVMNLQLIAQESAATGGSAIQLVILLMIPLAMYFLMIRPQRRRMKETQALQRSLAVGDDVITTSGIYGVITGIEGDRFWLEIDNDVQIQIARSAVQGRVSLAAEVSAPAENPSKSDDA